MLRRITVVGSLVGTREDRAEVFQPQAQGRTQVELETRDLGQVNEYFRDVQAGSVLWVALQPPMFNIKVMR